MKMSHLRHACYMLGNTQQEKLDNCELHDKTNDKDKFIMFMKLVGKCENQKSIDYVQRMINKKLI